MDARFLSSGFLLSSDFKLLMTSDKFCAFKPEAKPKVKQKNTKHLQIIEKRFFNKVEDDSGAGKLGERVEFIFIFVLLVSILRIFTSAKALSKNRGIFNCVFKFSAKMVML